MDRGVLWFEREDEFLGVAFDNIPTDTPIYPSFSAVFGNSCISLVYTGLPELG